MELVAGKGGKGQITLEGLRIELVDVDRAVYINGSASLYRHLAGPAAARLLQGQWLKVTAGSGRSYSSLAAVTDLGELIDSALTVNGPLAGAGTTTIDGQRAVGVTDSSTGGTLYVATTGIPYPLEILKHGAGSGRIAFNRWNKPVLLAPPANAINVEQLQSGH